MFRRAETGNCPFTTWGPYLGYQVSTCRVNINTSSHVRLRYSLSTLVQFLIQSTLGVSGHSSVCSDAFSFILSVTRLRLSHPVHSVLLNSNTEELEVLPRLGFWLVGFSFDH